MANLNKEKKYHYIYKTTNLITGKFYVGMHSTNNINDGYLGSGKRLRYSIRKYGLKNFKLDILEVLPDRKSLEFREQQLVNEDLLKDPMCINLKLGGNGGNVGPNGEVYGGDKFKAAQLYWEKPENKERLKIIASQRGKRLWKEGRMQNFKYDWTGKRHSEESKIKIGEANKIKQSGSYNSQFGTMWITNGSENKKIKKENTIPTGWYKGRI